MVNASSALLWHRRRNACINAGDEPMFIRKCRSLCNWYYVSSTCTRCYSCVDKQWIANESSPFSCEPLERSQTLLATVLNVRLTFHGTFVEVKRKPQPWRTKSKCWRSRSKLLKRNFNSLGTQTLAGTFAAFKSCRRSWDWRSSNPSCDSRGMRVERFAIIPR